MIFESFNRNFKAVFGDILFSHLDFDTIFRNTNTSYNPDNDGRSSGRSGADIERILAFHAIGKKDPLEYVGGWDVALKNALSVQLDWSGRNE